jgi:hypothetical protein
MAEMRTDHSKFPLISTVRQNIAHAWEGDNVVLLASWLSATPALSKVSSIYLALTRRQRRYQNVLNISFNTAMLLAQFA